MLVGDEQTELAFEEKGVECIMLMADDDVDVDDD
jgi:hypothetical protein